MKPAFLGALLVLAGGCTKQFESPVTTAVCAADQVIGGVGSGQPANCVPLAQLSVPSAPHADHAAVADQANLVVQADSADLADVALDGPAGPWVLGGDDAGTFLPTSLAIVDGGMEIDLWPPRRQVSFSLEGGTTAFSTVLSTNLTLTHEENLLIEASGTVAGPGNLSDSSHSSCELSLNYEGTTTLTEVPSYGHPALWHLSLLTQGSPGSHTIEVDLVTRATPDGGACQVDPNGNTYGTQPATLNVEAF